jgi:hypothetical protein
MREFTFVVVAVATLADVVGVDRFFMNGSGTRDTTICSGPGKFSVDYWLGGKLLR